MSEDERVRQQLVVDDRTVADHVVILDESDRLFGATPHQNSAFGESSQTESIAVAQIAQTPAQRKIKCADRIVRPRVRFIQPVVNCAFAVPAFTDRIWLETGAAAQRAQFLNRTNHPAAVTLDHVVAEPVEADFFQ